MAFTNALLGLREGDARPEAGEGDGGVRATFSGGTKIRCEAAEAATH